MISKIGRINRINWNYLHFNIVFLAAEPLLSAIFKFKQFLFISFISRIEKKTILLWKWGFLICWNFWNFRVMTRSRYLNAARLNEHIFFINDKHRYLFSHQMLEIWSCFLNIKILHINHLYCISTAQLINIILNKKILVNSIPITS